MRLWLAGCVLFLSGAAGFSPPVAPLRDTNSHAASARGAKAYQEQQFGAAVQSFATVQKLALSPRGAFNLGTAQVAQGQREQGSATLAEAIRDPALRADALFNRGNSALAAKAFQHAVRDYIDVLKLRPDHPAAKRNLEIALRQHENAQRASSGQKSEGGKQQQEQAKSNQPSDQPPRGEMDLEALLRSVQQQEQEELRRMKGRASEGRVGW
jgi:Ca-activated chloride channel homolog